MLTIGTKAKIFLVTGITDMRKSFDTLSAIVSETLGGDPYSGDVYAFCNRGRNRVKLLVWDESGFLLCAKRLEAGTFAWPTASETSIDLSSEELQLLLGGIDVRDAKRRSWYKRPTEQNMTSCS